MWWLFACTPPPAETAAPTDPDAALVSLDAPRLIRRMSLDLRGTLPSEDELDEAENADEATIEEIRDGMLEDPAFEDRLVIKLNEIWHTRVDEFLLKNVEYPAIRDKDYEYAWNRSVGEEPLRLMAYIASHDRPWTEVVTADYTMANDLMAQAWPVDYPTGDTGWQVSTYTDGRPGAGVLTTDGLWWRYYTTVSNYNRGRAAAIARLLLCQDYLARPVSFDSNVALVDQSGIESALRSNPYCLGCHSSIDPLASTLFGFWVANEYNTTEMDHYHPEREELGQTLLGQAPSFYGIPLNGLANLGEQIAIDPRFYQCTAETFASLLWGRDVADDDFDRIDTLRKDFEAGDGTLKPLLREITNGPVYRAGSLDATASDEQIADEDTTRIFDADLLDSVLGNLSEFTWNYEDFDQLDNDSYGYRIQMGGVDGSYVTSPQRTPSLTWLLVAQRASEGAANQMADLLDSSDSPTRIFQYVTSASVPGDDAFTNELKSLHWRLYGVRADDAWLTQITALWTEVDAGADAHDAWAAVLSAMLQDPLFLTY